MGATFSKRAYSAPYNGIPRRLTLAITLSYPLINRHFRPNRTPKGPKGDPNDQNGFVPMDVGIMAVPDVPE